jgi:hypothetical protein
MIRELMAAAQHKIWAHWMGHLFDQGSFNEDGSWTMPKDKVERWQRQMSTEYADLSEEEKQGDRDQVEKMLNHSSSVSSTT